MKRSTHEVMKRHGLLLGSDDRTLDKEFVFALDVERWFLLHGLQED